MTPEVRTLPPVQLFSRYQPIVGPDGLPVGFEALVRGQRSGVGVSAAELFGGDVDERARRLLDRSAAEAAVRGAVDWLDDRLLFINLAPVTLLSAATWLDALLEHLRDHGIAPTQVVVELNERQSLSEHAWLVCLLEQAREAGLRFALDDELGDVVTTRRCRALQPEYVKLDGSVVRGLDRRAGRLALTRALQDADSVGAVVIAEQVETAAQLDLLRSFGIELVQGWLTGAPAEGASAAAGRRSWGRRPLSAAAAVPA